MRHLLRMLMTVLGLVIAAISSAQVRLITQIAQGADMAAIAQDYNLAILDHTQPAPFVLYLTPPGADVELLKLSMRGDARIVWVEDDDDLTAPENSGGGKGSTIAAVGGRNGLYAENAQMLQQISFSAQNVILPGKPIRVAVLDTGLTPGNRMLWFKTVASINLIEPGLPAWDMPRGQDTNGNGDFDEAAGHGTMVSGIIDQMSPQAKFIIARVADSDGYSSAWNIAKGLAFSVTNGAAVVNISLGSEDSIIALSDVMDWVEANGVLVVAPIGNNGLRMALDPSEISKVICVTGVDKDDLKADFSNWDSKADIAAPAVGIKSFWWQGNLGIWSGTSFASPFVAGSVVEGLRRRQGSMSLEILRDIIESTGDNIEHLNPQYGDELGLRLNVARLQDAIINFGKR